MFNCRMEKKGLYVADVNLCAETKNGKGLNLIEIQDPTKIHRAFHARV